MTTSQQRISEFTRRQLYYKNNFVARLNAIDGKWQYTTYVWTTLTLKPVKVDSGKYNGEDPYDLIEIAERIIGKQIPGYLLNEDVIAMSVNRSITQSVGDLR